MKDQPTHLQLIAALAAMSEANVALRTGAGAARAVSRAARCLDVLANAPDLAPWLRRLCDRSSSQWASAIASRAVDEGSLHAASERQAALPSSGCQVRIGHGASHTTALGDQ
jgi:hypothetical protein